MPTTVVKWFSHIIWGFIGSKESHRGIRVNSIKLNPSEKNHIAFHSHQECLGWEPSWILHGLSGSLWFWKLQNFTIGKALGDIWSILPPRAVIPCVQQPWPPCLNTSSEEEITVSQDSLYIFRQLYLWIPLVIKFLLTSISPEGKQAPTVGPA